MRSTASLSCLLLFPILLFGQIEKEGEPVSWNLGQQIGEPSVVEDLPPINTAALIAEDATVNELKSQPYRFAYSHEVNYDLDNSGQWTNLKYGDRIWRLGIRAEEAYSMSIQFSNLKIPSGALLYIYTADQSEFFGPISSKNNSQNHKLGTQPIKGNEIVIEYFEPYAVRGKGEVNIGSIAQGYRDLLSDDNTPKDCFETLVLEENSALSAISNSLMMILVDEGTRAITGALVNNTSYDGTPYVITSSELGSSDPLTWVFLVKMSSQECSPSGSCWSKSLSGATVLAVDSVAGVSLLEINENPPGKWQTYYNGWSFENQYSGVHFCAQHALAKKQSISFTDEVVSGICWQMKDAVQVPHWSSGTTYSGSAGSPLLNQDHLICGTFIGGFDSCLESDKDYFSNLSHSWDLFRNYLDPTDSGDKALHGFYAGFIPDSPTSDHNAVVTYPNPSDGLFSIFNLDGDPLRYFEVYDSSGRLVMSRPVNNQQLDLRELFEGLYTVVAYFSKSTATERIVIQ